MRRLGIALLFLVTSAHALPPHVPGELVVRFTHGRAASARSAVRARYGAQLSRALHHSPFELWRVDETTTSVAAIAHLISADAAVAYAEPNYLYTIHRTPNDLYFAEDLLWGLNNTGQFGGTVDADIDAPEAWDFTIGGDIIVGVVDSGVDYTHPDLAANMWRNPGEIPDDGIDNDGNGYVDDVVGIDTVNNTGDPLDDLGHGTHCAGTIAGVGNNTQGVVGVCWRARIMALKFIAGDGAGNAFGALACIEYAIHHGARVLNNSWGGGPYSQALQDMIALAEASNVLFCAAAGNGGRDGIGDNNDLTPDYPSSYPNSNVLAVAASDFRDALAVFSNYGSNSVDVAAPGVDIISTVPGNRYALYNGTSMATPHVCGAAALLLALNPRMTHIEVKNALMAAVDKIPAFAPKMQSGGRLNVFNALRGMHSVFFDQPAYFTHTPVTILLINTNLPGGSPVPVTLFSDAGDEETLLVWQHTPGNNLFTNTIPLVHGVAVPGNGVLEGVHGVQLFALAAGMSSTGMAGVSESLVITIATPPITVPYETNVYAVLGSNNGNVLVAMTVSNAATGQALPFGATNEWLAPALALSETTDRNVFWVTGSNAYGFADAAMVAVTRMGPANLTNHVAQASGAHQWPYASWADAATSVVAAVNTAPDGNLILVATGRYHGTELRVTRAVTVRGVDGPAQTILDAGYAHRCLSISTNALVEGLTLLQGAHRYGGGVHLAAGTARNCIIISNAAGVKGGGVYLESGGTLDQCVVADNMSVGDGGGVYVLQDGTVAASELRGNQALMNGGAAVLYRGGLVSRCRVLANRCEDNGGGIHVDSFSAPTGLVADTLLAGNVARKYGGGLSFYFGGDARSCTLVSNRSEILAGGGLYAYRGGAVRNSIIQFNNAGLGANWYAANGSIAFSSSCTTPHPGGISNIVADPLFTQDGAWQLLGASPCVDAADAAWLVNTLDCAGAPRVHGPASDMGAFEFAPAGLLCYFTCVTNVAEPDTPLAFAAQAWGTNLDTLVCAWDFDADGAIELITTNDMTAVHAYADPGVYGVRVDVNNAAGERSDYLRTAAVTIIPEPLWGVCVLGLALAGAQRRRTVCRRPPFIKGAGGFCICHRHTPHSSQACSQMNNDQ